MRVTFDMKWNIFSKTTIMGYAMSVSIELIAKCIYIG